MFGLNQDSVNHLNLYLHPEKVSLIGLLQSHISQFVLTQRLPASVSCLPGPEDRSVLSVDLLLLNCATCTDQKS
jgi:hypothetical protein